ncbi:MAG TPA: zinc-binding dehydrogenase [Terriglobia bacterium]|nr:zinc-binding dehydrogenase [Terriglobia bacterium]
MAESSMTAVVHYALQPGAVELREVPRPRGLADDEVLLASRAIGVCGSEVHQYHNTHSWPVNVPVILGHEFCGVVAAAGKSVKGFREGDRVTSETAARICGHCIYCRTGEYNLCPERLGFGYGVDGAMAEFVKVPARCLHHLPDSVSFESAALTEPCSVAYNATCVKTHIRPGDSVLIFGPGPIGLLCLALARLSGAGWSAVAGLKQDERRLAVARQIGAERTIVLGKDNQQPLTEAIRALGDGLGVDVVMDATGHSATLKSAMAAVRPGGQITKVGWGPQPLDFSLDPLVGKAARLQGSFSHNYPIWEKVIALMASGRLDPRPLVGRMEPLAGWRSCFDGMASGEIVKGVLKPAG